MRTQFFVAEKLGMTLSELRNRMTEDELAAWYVYYKIRADEEEAAYKKARRR